MQTQLKITLQDLEHSAALDTRIRAKVAKLEQAFPRLIGCHVVVSEPHRHRQNPRSFAITLNIAFPSGEVVVTAGYLFSTYWTAMRNLMYANK